MPLTSSIAQMTPAVPVPRVLGGHARSFRIDRHKIRLSYSKSTTIRCAT